MMNDQSFSDAQCFNRLVDGELSADEYRELLARLSQEPDGWRRCAMAFLESQAWGQELPALRNEWEQADARPNPAPVRSSRPLRRSSLFLAMAASFLVAFALGAWWRTLTEPVPSVVREASPSRPARQLAKQPQPQEFHDGVSGQAAIDRLTFVVDTGDGQRERFEMPVFRGDDVGAHEAIDRAIALPPDIERAIRQAGFEVHRQREWAPVQLRDGRRAVFPIDQLEITPVSSNTYQ